MRVQLQERVDDFYSVTTCCHAIVSVWELEEIVNSGMIMQIELFDVKDVGLDEQLEILGWLLSNSWRRSFGWTTLEMCWESGNKSHCYLLYPSGDG